MDNILAMKSSLRENPQDSRGNLSCHTERSEVSRTTKEIFRYAQNDNRDISAFSKPQYDKEIKDLESKIDLLVYKLYDLDSQEIEIIES